MFIGTCIYVWVEINDIEMHAVYTLYKCISRKNKLITASIACSASLCLYRHTNRMCPVPQDRVDPNQ